MTSKEAWNMFRTTGDIIDYIIYSKIKHFELKKLNNNNI